MLFSKTVIGLALLGMVGAIPTAGAAEDGAEQFEKEVRPLLAERCYECHGPEKQKGGLRLDHKAGMLGAGDSEEAAVVPGKSAESLLVKRVLANDPDEAMPPKGKRLEPRQIAALKLWIDRGAQWPEGKAAEEPVVAAAQSARGKVITEKDRAFWAFQPPRTAGPGLQSDPWCRQPLDRLVLARLREQSLAPSPAANRVTYLRRVTYDLTGLPPTPEERETFLADTQPGAEERLVERLLGSARFGERFASLWLPLARYAEDQAHQVGADTKYFYPNAYRYRAWVVDAFNRDIPYDRFLKLQLAADQMKDAPPGELAALGFLGLGPKYYNRNRLEVMADEWEDRVDTVTRTTLGLTVACARCHDHKFDPISAADYHALAGVFASTRMVNRTPGGAPEKDDTMAQKMSPETLHIVEDGKPQDLPVFIRGNVERKGPVTPRRFLTVISSGEPQPFREGSGRMELAQAIASRENPLAARVFVNRVWGLMFGQPLVVTPSNFGNSGAQPSNQALLDDLAARFMDGGWSVKGLVREMALSATYRQCSAHDAAKAARDPENTSLWRMNRRRLTVEQWRDTVLLVSGELQEEVGARSEELENPANTRRTLYARVSRLSLSEMLMQFDYPDANVHAEKRSVTTTPLQKLFMLNSPFMQRRAAALAARISQVEGGDEEHIAAVYAWLFSREPDSTERALGVQFLRQGSTSGMTPLERYAQALLASNELLYVD